jgi:hypothetical protein
METKLARSGRCLVIEPVDTWANTILFELAEALGYQVNYATQSITADPDEILDEATELIWRYRDAAES